MDYKEKLRLAKEALDSGSYDKETIEYIFPELKENDDTRVKNKLIEFFKGYYPDKEWWGNITQGNILAWLEEHGEQKSWSKEDEMQLDAAIHLVSNTGHIETTNWLKDLKNRVLPQPKQEWGEEDEMMIKFTLTYFRTRGALENSDIIKWLKSLKDRVQPQPKQEWSEEDENKIRLFMQLTEGCDNYKELQYWLKTLKNRVQPKQEWSEEDEINLFECIKAIKGNYSTAYAQELSEWLKSLRPQNTWKPSDEQFKLLKHIMENVPLSYRDKSEVGELYLDLKRLL